MLIGLVGKPNAGKSTFFKACTLAEIEIASYPFTTIKANEGVGFVRVKCPETDLKELKEKEKTCNPQHGFCIKGERFAPVRITFWVQLTFLQSFHFGISLFFEHSKRISYCFLLSGLISFS